MRTAVAILCVCTATRALGAECPADTVQVTSKVCIDKYEWPGTGPALPTYPVLAVSGLPEPWISQGPIKDAEGICLVRGMRVCRLEEWAAACKGPGGAQYPYGEKYDAAACNTSKRFRAFDEKKVWKREFKELAKLDQSEPIGSYPRCVSAVGAYDMIGNAEEWVRCDSGKYGWCLVGGFWAKPRTCNEAIIVHSPYWHFYETGGRCCVDI